MFASSSSRERNGDRSSSGAVTIVPSSNRFEESFGYGPKTLDRILRFHRFRRLRQASGNASTAVLAVEAGYADQAHLIRESRRLSGITPSALAATGA